MAGEGLRTLGRSAPVFAAWAGWRAGVPRAEDRLVRALASPDDDVRDLAGVLVGRSGDRARGLLHRALDEPAARPRALLLLGDLGDPALAPSIEPYTTDPDPATARAAHDALRTLEAVSQAAAPTPGPAGGPFG